MEIKSLGTVPFSTLMECFLEAFKNYYVEMPTDYEFYRERWRMANVSLELSYGMFDHKKLVGFIINAIDNRNGNLVAFNTGTGILPEYRRQGIVNSIYQFAIPKLKQHGVSECRLEVIKANNIAIKAYKGIGFKITKTYKCFGGDILLENNRYDFELKKVTSNYFDWNTLTQNNYSWDNHYNVITKGTYNYYVVLSDDTPDSYFIINPENGYIAQFNVLRESEYNWMRLFEAIQNISKTIKINNVDKEFTDKMNVLRVMKLKNTIDQYEMEMVL